MNICFTLSMPNRGSWNGKWSGEGNLYAKVVLVSQSKGRELDGKSFHYSWSDGWGANVSCRQVAGSEIRKIKKHSRGFCGYEWMIDSIRFYGKIYADHENPKSTVGVTAEVKL